MQTHNLICRNDFRYKERHAHYISIFVCGGQGRPSHSKYVSAPSRESVTSEERVLPVFLKADSSDLLSSFVTFRNTTMYITVCMCSKALGIRSQFSAEETFLDCLKKSYVLRRISQTLSLVTSLSSVL